MQNPAVTSLSPAPVRRRWRLHRLSFPLFLVAGYGLLIVYASLQPFEGWTAPSPDTPFFLWSSPGRFTRSDIWLNVLSYLPFGFCAALFWPRQAGLWRPVIGAALLSALLSSSMEWLQMYLPTRIASVVDLAANTVGGALGATVAAWLSTRTLWRRQLALYRYRLFRGRQAGDLGLTLLCLWFLAQANPGIPLFSATFTPLLDGPPDRASLLLEAAQTGFNLLGVGLFLALLLRRRRHTIAAVLLLIGCALMFKSLAALALVKASELDEWLSRGVLVGAIAGFIWLLPLLFLPRGAMRVVCTVALLSAVTTTLLSPETLFAKAPLPLFQWHYGQLRHFNGLTHAALMLWPFVITLYLFWQAGRERD